ncbi:hypothetical protein MXB_1121, partial [Myxobolus squamalis]
IQPCQYPCKIIVPKASGNNISLLALISIRDVLHSNVSTLLNFDILRPYSSELNPIEEVFSYLKSRYNNKRLLPNNSNILKQYVVDVITEIIADVDFRNFYTRMSEFMD